MLQNLEHTSNAPPPQDKIQHPNTLLFSNFPSSIPRCPWIPPFQWYTLADTPFSFWLQPISLSLFLFHLLQTSILCQDNSFPHGSGLAAQEGCAGISFSTPRVNKGSEPGSLPTVFIYLFAHWVHPLSLLLPSLFPSRVTQEAGRCFLSVLPLASIAQPGFSSSQLRPMQEGFFIHLTVMEQYEVNTVGTPQIPPILLTG